MFELVALTFAFALVAAAGAAQALARSASLDFAVGGAWGTFPASNRTEVEKMREKNRKSRVFSSNSSNSSNSNNSNTSNTSSNSSTSNTSNTSNNTNFDRACAVSSNSVRSSITDSISSNISKPRAHAREGADAALALKFYSAIVTVIRPQSQSDRTTFGRVCRHLAELVRRERLTSQEAWRRLEDAVREAIDPRSRNRAAVFVHIMKREFGYGKETSSED